MFLFELIASLTFPLVSKNFIQIDDFDFVSTRTGAVKTAEDDSVIGHRSEES